MKINLIVGIILISFSLIGIMFFYFNPHIENEYPEVDFQVQEDLLVDSEITKSYLQDSDLIVEYLNPNNEKVWINNLSKDRYKLQENKIIIYNFDEKEDYFEIHIGENSDIYIFGISENLDFVIKYNKVYYNDSNVYLSAEPHTLHNSGWVYFNLTSKIYSGNIDAIWGFNTSIVKPTKAELYKPHNITWNTSHSFFMENVSNIELSSESCEIGNEYNNFKRNGTYQIITGYVNETNEIIYSTTSKIVCFDSYNQSGTNYSIIYHTKHTKIVNWIDISDKFGSINYNYDGLNKWWYLKNLSIQVNKNYQIRAFLKIPISLDESFGKYGWALKPSGETIQEAINSGHFYYLDPWWNLSWDYRQEINITSFENLTNFQIELNINNSNVGNNFNWTNNNSIRFTNSTNDNLDYWIESWNSIANTSTIWVNVTFLENNTNTTIYMYYGNDVVDSESNGTKTFELFDDFNDNSLDTDIWDIIAGSPTESGGIIEFDGADEGITSDKSFNENYIAMGNISMEKVASANTLWGWSKIGSGYGSFYYSSGGNDFRHYYGDTSWLYTDLAVSDGGWHNIKISMTSAQNKFWYDNILKSSPTSNLPTGDQKINMYSGTGIAYLKVDWVAVAKYTTTKPLFYFGGEKNTTDLESPTSNHPSDASYIKDTPQVIGWILQDEMFPGDYTILRNGSVQNASTSWTNNVSLNVWVNTTTIGNNWNYTIKFNDSSGNEGIPDTVFINITLSTANFVVNLISPEDGLKTTDNTTDHIFNVNGSEATYNCTLYYDNSPKGNDVSVLNNTETTITSSEVADGFYDWYINCTAEGVTNQSEIREIGIGAHPPNCSIQVTPSNISANSTGNVEIILTCEHPIGINISRFMFTNTVEGFVDVGVPNVFSIRPPENNRAVNISDGVNISEKILVACGRNESKWFEDIGVFTDIFSYCARIQNDRGVIINNTSTTATFNLTIEVEEAFRNMVFLGREKMYDAPKNDYAINKNNPLLIKFWEIPILRQGSNVNFTAISFRNLAYTGNPVKNLLTWYCNSSYDPTGSIKPVDSSNCVYTTAITQSMIDTISYTVTNSSYNRQYFGIINGKIAGIQATSPFYVYFESDVTGSQYYYARYATSDSGTNVSFNESKTAWSSTDDGVSWIQMNSTIDMWVATIREIDQLQFGVYVKSNTGTNYTNLTFYTDDVGYVNFPITVPSIKHYCQGSGEACVNGEDWDLNGTYYQTMAIHIGASIDPNGVSTVNHSLYLYNSDGTYNMTINNSFYSEDGDVHVDFNTLLVQNGEYKVNITAVADDNPDDIQSVITFEKFTIYNPKPEDPNPVMTPTTLYTNTSANCTAIFLDNDSATGTLIFRWYVDSVSVYNDTKTSVANNSMEWSLLYNGNFSKNEVVNCTVLAIDENRTTTNSTAKTVQNTPPSFVLNYPIDGATGVELNPYLNITYYDIDGDVGNITYYYGNPNFTLNEFSNSNSIENFTYTENGTVTRYLKMLKTYDVTTSTLDLKGFDSGVYLDGWNFSIIDNAEGITRNETYFWVLESEDFDRVNKYSSNGIYIDYFDISANTDLARGITFNGTHFHIIDRGDEEVHRYLADGTYDGLIFDVSPQTNNSRDIDFNGTYFWVLDFIDDRIYRYLADGTYDNWYFNMSTQSTNMNGFIFNGDYFFVISGSEEVYIYLANGTYYKYFDLKIPFYQSRGICQQHTTFWTMSRMTDTVNRYKINYTSNLSLDSANSSGVHEWNWTGSFLEINGTQTADLNITLINNYLSSCTADGNGYCYIPIEFYSDSAGILEVSNIIISSFGVIGENTTVSNGSYATFQWGDLIQNTIYKWFIITTDGDVNVTSEIWNFTTNSQPSTPIISFEPHSPIINDTVVANANSTDADNDTLTYYYRFYDNTTDTNLTNWTTNTNYTINLSNMEGHNWIIYAYANDGELNGSVGSISLIITNLTIILPELDSLLYGHNITSRFNLSVNNNITCYEQYYNSTTIYNLGAITSGTHTYYRNIDFGNHTYKVYCESLQNSSRNYTKTISNFMNVYAIWDIILYTENEWDILFNVSTVDNGIDLLVYCEGGSQYYVTNISNIVENLTLLCDVEFISAKLEYTSSSYFRSIASEGLNVTGNISIYLIDAYQYSVLEIPILMTNSKYYDSMLIVYKQGVVGEETLDYIITQGYFDVVRKFPTYLTKDNRYLLRLVTDDEIRDIGWLYAFEAGEQSLDISQVSLTPSVALFNDMVKLGASYNNTTDVLYITYEDATNLTQNITFEVLNNTGVYFTQTYYSSNVTITLNGVPKNQTWAIVYEICHPIYGNSPIRGIMTIVDSIMFPLLIGSWLYGIISFVIMFFTASIITPRNLLAGFVSMFVLMFTFMYIGWLSLRPDAIVIISIILILGMILHLRGKGEAI